MTTGDRMTGKSALIAGASGLVGSHCLARLLDHPQYAQVIAWVRTPLPTTHPKLIQQVVEFDRLQQWAAVVALPSRQVPAHPGR